MELEWELEWELELKPLKSGLNTHEAFDLDPPIKSLGLSLGSTPIEKKKSGRGLFS